MTKFEPQTDFLTLINLSDGYSIGNKFGLGFYGQWVWTMKNFIDKGFMDLFDVHKLFERYDKDSFIVNEAEESIDFNE